MPTRIKLTKIFFMIGVVEIISSILIYPMISILWRPNIVNYLQAMADYSEYALFIGLLTMAFGWLQMKTKKEIVTNLFVLYLTLSLIFLGDRLLLAKYGYGLWRYDNQLHYIHRPNTSLSWGSAYDNKMIKINSDGYHDDEFKAIKKSNGVRIFVLGNSITMGHGVTKEETFSNQLEKLYDSCNVDIFNLGVQGYSAIQELEVLKRSIKFDPDIIFIEFCLNDITEPTYVDKNLGGKGYDYHNIIQIRNSVLGYLMNETGFGKLLFMLKHSAELENAKQNELYSVQLLCENPFFNKNIEESWKQNFASLKKIKQIAVSRSNEFFVLIFPYTFQFFNEHLKKPQKFLKTFLLQESISYLDFTDVFEHIIQNEGVSGINIEQSISKYYLDEDHYTMTGHKIIAEQIKRFLANQIEEKICTNEK